MACGAVSSSAASGGGRVGSCARCCGSGFAPLPQRLGDLTVHCGKLLHEGAPVRAGAEKYMLRLDVMYV